MILKASTILILALLVGCSGTYQSRLEFNPSEPIRIAVLPFIQVDNSGAPQESDPNLLIDNLSLVSSKLKQTPAEFIQGLVQSELANASLDLIPPGIVSARLIHSNYELPGSKPPAIDIKRILATPPDEICSKVIPCDAVLYGQLTSWNRSYFGLQSVMTVGIDLKLVSAKSRKVLFHSTAKDSDSRGITKGPTGISDLVLGPIQGLDNEIITDLARSVVIKALAPLSGRGRPEFLSSPLPIIIAAAHSAINGYLPSGRRLIVVAYGTPGLLGSFDIAGFTEGIPLAERDAGHYVGEFVALRGDTFTNAVISVSLRDKNGRITTEHLSNSPVTLSK